MLTPTVSIIIPCYNKRPYVAKAIESALSQTAACEVIVVDDGSTDGSLDIIRSYGSRIRWTSGPNRGGSAARNRGLELATGNWIQFLDADDILPPEKIAVQIAAMEGASEDAMAFCPWAFFHDSGEVASPDARAYWRGYASGLELLVDMWYQGGFFPPHAWLTPRSLIERVGRWDEGLTGDDDGEFFGRLLVAASGLRFCAATRVFYRDPPVGSVSRDRSLKSARSCWQAFENVSAALLGRADDDTTRRACLSRARTTAYAWRTVPEVVDRAAKWERANRCFDLSPALPVKARWLVALFGLKRGLQLRDRLATFRTW